MSIIRLSFIDKTLYKTEDGNLVRDEKGKIDVQQALEEITLGDQLQPEFEKAVKLGEHLAKEISEKKKTDALPKTGPVVVMVHGFWYDPVSDIDNPHKRNFHFEKVEKWTGHQQHTTGWPLGLGLKQADEKGAEGLAVAFGWDSTPDALKLGRLDSTEKKKVLTLLAQQFWQRIKDHPIDSARDLIATKNALTALAKKGSEKAKELREKMSSITSLQKAEEVIAETLEQSGEAVVPLFDVVAKYSPEIYKQAYDRATTAAAALAHILDELTRKLERPITIFCHSLGSRVVIHALKLLAESKRPILNPHDPAKGRGHISQVIIVGGAEYRQRALAMREAVEMCGSSPTFYNFMGRRDRVLTHLAGLYHPLGKGNDVEHPIGCDGLGPRMDPDSHWIDLQLDKEKDGSHPLYDWLKQNWNKDKLIGASEKPGENETPQELGSTHPLGILNHWYYFTNPANMDLFCDIVRKPEDWALDRIRAKMPGIPEVKK